jgi:hypothetical protein
VIDRETLIAFDRRADFARFVCQRAGLAFALDRQQQWQVAGHVLTVELQLDRRELHVFFVRDGWPTSPDLSPRKSLCMAEVYAIAVTGQLRRFRRPELARWKTRALIEAGLIESEAVSLPPLPPNAPAAAVATWKAIAEVATIRATCGDAGPMPLVAPWLASLNGTNEQTIRAGKHWLARNGWIIHAADGPGRFGKSTHLWRLTPPHDMAL